MPPASQHSPLPRIVADYRRALSPGGQRQLGLFAIEGFRLVERALSNGTPLNHVLVGQKDFDQPGARLSPLLERLRNAEVPVTVAPDATIAELTEGRTLGAVLGLASIPPPPDLDQLCQDWKRNAVRRKLLVLEEMMDPGNVGALMRTAHALGVDAVVALGGTDPFHPRSARTSMGSVFRMPLIRWQSAATLLDLLQKHSVHTVGAATEGSHLLPEVRFNHQMIALFVGNEGKGLSPSLRQMLDQLVAIPMSHSIDSLSVNAATAVMLYAMNYRQSGDEEHATT
jgi:tRNA G18 (ribose-2'-O)-methylase SpoU